MSAVESELPPLSPSREEFRSLTGRRNLVPVYAEPAADLDTPPSAFMRPKSRAMILAIRIATPESA